MKSGDKMCLSKNHDPTDALLALPCWQPRKRRGGETGFLFQFTKTSCGEIPLLYLDDKCLLYLFLNGAWYVSFLPFRCNDCRIKNKKHHWVDNEPCKWLTFFKASYWPESELRTFFKLWLFNHEIVCLSIDFLFASFPTITLKEPKKTRHFVVITWQVLGLFHSIFRLWLETGH